MKEGKKFCSLLSYKSFPPALLFLSDSLSVNKNEFVTCGWLKRGRWKFHQPQESGPRFVFFTNILYNSRLTWIKWWWEIGHRRFSKENEENSWPCNTRNRRIVQSKVLKKKNGSTRSYWLFSFSLTLRLHFSHVFSFTLMRTVQKGFFFFFFLEANRKNVSWEMGMVEDGRKKWDKENYEAALLLLVGWWLPFFRLGVVLQKKRVILHIGGGFFMQLPFSQLSANAKIKKNFLEIRWINDAQLETMRTCEINFSDDCVVPIFTILLNFHNFLDTINQHSVLNNCFFVIMHFQ